MFRIRGLSVVRRGFASAAPPPGLGASGLLFFGGLTAATGGLGAWQCQRYLEKVEEVQQRERTLKDAPRSLVHAGDFAEVPAFAKVTVSGTFDHAKEMRLMNRGPPESRHRAAGGLATGPIGDYVVTPFRLEDGTVVFANRGWVPRNTGDWARPSGEVTLVGVVTSMEQKNTFSPPNTPEKDGGRLFWTEERQMQTYADADAIVPGVLVQVVHEAPATAAAAAGAVEVVRKQMSDFMKFPVSPETHMGYAATWFGLCFFGIVLTVLRARRGGALGGLASGSAMPEALRPDLKKVTGRRKA